MGNRVDQPRKSARANEYYAAWSNTDAGEELKYAAKNARCQPEKNEVKGRDYA